MADSCYVFSDLSGAPALVGRMTYEFGVNGSFQYARSFLESGRAFSLDPVNLPLQTSAAHVLSVPYMFGALMDAGPDDWGRRALAYRGKPADGLYPLLVGSGSGVGDLLFSLSRDGIKPRPTPPGLDALRLMIEGVDDIEQGDPLPPEIAKLFEAGSSMGGARPKAVVAHEGKLWLAKFPSRSDVLDQPRVEHASLRLAEAAKIRVPETRIHEIGGRAVLLVERFDATAVDGRMQRQHFLSMAAVLTVGRRLRPDAVKREQSYMGMASFLAAHGAAPAEDQHQLFRRMCFNVLLGHVDDHQRNHGFLMPAAGAGYRLAPAYDMAPSNGHAESVRVLRDYQAIGIGKEGALRTRDNLMSATREFGLTREEAENVLEEVAAVVRQWEQVFAEHGVSERDRRLVANRVLAIPDLSAAPARASALDMRAP